MLDLEQVGKVLQVTRNLTPDGLSMVVMPREMRFAAQVVDHVAFIDKECITAKGNPRRPFLEDGKPRFRAFLRILVERTHPRSTKAARA